MIKYFINLVKSPSAIIGLIASIIVLVSMCFNTRTIKGELLMRSLNFVGSILSVIYGLMLGPDGFGMIILNGTLMVVNLLYLIKSIQNKKEQT